MAKEYLDINGLSYYTDNLTAYVDNEVAKNKQVIIYKNKSSFPTIGEQDCIYFDKSEPQIYAWNGTDYVKLGGSQAPSTSLEIGTDTGTAYDGGKGAALETKVATIESVNTTQTNNISSLQTELEKLRGLYSKMSGLTYTFTSGDQTATIDGVSTTLQSGVEFPVLWSLKNELTGDVVIEMVRPAFNFMNDMSSMFSGCGDLTSLNLDQFDTAHVYKMDRMFYNCKTLTDLSLDGFNTSEVTSFSQMFQNCSSLTSLNLFSFNTSKATNLMGMFHGCSNLTEIIGDSLTTENVSNLGNMFYGCSKLTSPGWQFNTSKAKTTTGMFSGCSSLTTLDMSGFDFSKVTNAKNMFKGCTSLSLITSAPSNIGVDLDMSECPLTAGSAVFIIAGLKNVSETEKLNLKLKASTFSALTEEQKKVATDKNWNVISV